MTIVSKNRNRKRSDFRQAKSLLHPGYIILPVIIGAIVIALMFFSEYKDFTLEHVRLSRYFAVYFLLAWLCMVGRDFGLTWRFRTLTGRNITWGQALRVNMLCEFTSAITPSTVGGSSFGMIYLKGEGLNLGRSTAIMMTTLFLDELFFVVSCPIVMLLIPFEELFTSIDHNFSTTLKITFWIVYSGLFLWTAILFWGIFIKPQVIKSFFNWVFSWKILRRWKSGALEMGDNIVYTSDDLKKRSIFWWIRAFFATALSWISRYSVVIALFLAFGIDADLLMVLARQLVVWVVLTVSPTPGGSGLSEWIFAKYYGDMIPVASISLLIALCWRFISYYIYLIIGLCVFPSWLRGWVRRSRQFKRENNGNDR